MRKENGEVKTRKRKWKENKNNQRENPAKKSMFSSSSSPFLYLTSKLSIPTKTYESSRSKLVKLAKQSDDEEGRDSATKRKTEDCRIIRGLDKSNSLLGDIKKEEEDENEVKESEIVKWLKVEVRVRKKEGKKEQRKIECHLEDISKLSSQSRSLEVLFSQCFNSKLLQFIYERSFEVAQRAL